MQVKRQGSCGWRRPWRQALAKLRTGGGPARDLDRAAVSAGARSSADRSGAMTDLLRVDGNGEHGGNGDGERSGESHGAFCRGRRDWFLRKYGGLVCKEGRKRAFNCKKF